MAAAAGLIAGAATPAGAATADYNGPVPGESGSLVGSIDGDEGTFGGGLFSITIDGEVESQAYCIDINTPISGSPSYDEVEWGSSGIENLVIVEAILRHYYPNGNGPGEFALEGSNADKARATQAAIWHFTDGFELSTEPGDNPATVVANYEKILAAVEAGLEGFGEPTVTLAITPPESTEGTVGGLVGPYVIDTTADSVTVTPSEGVSLVDSEGEPRSPTFVDGTEFWLTSDTAGSGTVSATASATATAGRVFMAQRQQTLILAAPVTIEAAAEAVGVVRAADDHHRRPRPRRPRRPRPPPRRCRSRPTRRSCPRPTTVPITPSQGEGGGLPVTGAQSLILALVAVLLVALGVGFRIVSKRAEANG